MTDITRRNFLKQAPVVAVVAGTPVALKAAEVSTQAEDGEMKCMRLARELFNAMKAHYGDGCVMTRFEETDALYFAPPPPPARIVEFAGPGWYEVEARGENLPTEELWIEIDARFPPHPARGRIFKATTRDGSRYRCHFDESWLRQIIIRKIGILA